MAIATAFPMLQNKDPEFTRWAQAANAAFQPVASALANTPIMGAPPPSWVNLDFAPGAPGARFEQTASAVVVAYHVDDLGYVHTKGRATHAAGCAAGTALLTLPMGARPHEAQAFPVRGNGATYQSLAVSPAGVVTVEVAIPAGGTVDFTISFLAEA